ncbi:hypothetical protein KO507_15870 [Gilvimarinus agarilyticus]|uniref:hypothetical protein n=1 Tax=unclassified Gilvimarinus TaxID=2642066 RepID=UPI001C09E1B3|nr:MULTISPECIES: hypothetical protein [unclassified Gilvimarinus]MBU2887244.1 hypothetical protein [Gilvimarinus agarilyticus]MDO6571903.1 hypothetical protein [Gilvimarinus sp. 2_MG-2023]MDO6745972.1 hypothetical protein [Gilvimarinus sp. 1_MG-2023]
MSLQLIDRPSLQGPLGVEQLQQVQADMYRALARGDYHRVRQLDDTCAVVLDALVSANGTDKATLLDAMRDLKAVYRQMLQECNRLAQCKAVG